ncbi:MAG: hypothetical protein AVDCRST_MAG68-2554 [uncultured Gemmatimonadetes bacterium]|jgi:uncharacterized membrane protein YjfL (UPF0719 family)|uniref:DUF350 domain-containing protein n=1 Tax=uncultured Gemmatimonadota bacterium TaxID=203437 RepID=A0A6J4LGF2_9BACT|nr:MAG: hypothetical protein AVDCRST_MAG68-2554 [uncultured Gemmatimonadota bacterium]
MNQLANDILAVVIYSLLGIVILAVALVVVDRMTPGTLWKELIEEHNTALAIVMGAVVIAFAIVISAAIVG